MEDLLGFFWSENAFWSENSVLDFFRKIFLVTEFFGQNFLVRIFFIFFRCFFVDCVLYYRDYYRHNFSFNLSNVTKNIIKNHFHELKKPCSYQEKFSIIYRQLSIVKHFYKFWATDIHIFFFFHNFSGTWSISDWRWGFR